MVTSALGNDRYCGEYFVFHGTAEQNIKSIQEEGYYYINGNIQKTGAAYRAIG